MTIFYEVASPVTDDLTSHVYAAKIVGSDPNFVLRRVFLLSAPTGDITCFGRLSSRTGSMRSASPFTIAKAETVCTGSASGSSSSMKRRTSTTTRK